MATNRRGHEDDDDQKEGSRKAGVSDNMATLEGGNGNYNVSNTEQLHKGSSQSYPLTGQDLLSWVKELVINPGTAKIDRETDLKMRVEVIKFREHLLHQNPECRRSKRKLETFLNDAKAPSNSSSSSSDSNPSNPRKRSPLSCSTLRPSSAAAINSKKTVSAVSFSSGEEGLNSSESQGKLRVLTKHEMFPRAAIPVGTKYQAEVHRWNGPTNSDYSHGVPDALKLMGSKIWPLEGGNAIIADKKIGAGRPESCPCASPGSRDCVKLHIHEARELLQRELGPAFYEMKFDEIGAVISNSWTSKEEQRFETLVKKNPLSGNADFWELACKCFPSKSRKSILDYYYNVFLPKRVRLLNESSSPDQVESDDDHADHFLTG